LIVRSGGEVEKQKPSALSVFSTAFEKSAMDGFAVTIVDTPGAGGAVIALEIATEGGDAITSEVGNGLITEALVIL